MADVSKRSKLVELYVRKIFLPKMFRSQRFEPRALELITKGKHNFDAVSEDKKIVAEVKSNIARSDGRFGPGVQRSLISDLYYLSLIKAKYKYLIISDKKIHARFIHVMDKKIAPGIKIFHCDMPRDTKNRIRRIKGSDKK